MRRITIFVFVFVMATGNAGAAHSGVTGGDLACLTEANPDWAFSILDEVEGIRDTHLRVERLAFSPIINGAPTLIDVDWAACDLFSMKSDPVDLHIGFSSYLDVLEDEILLPTIVREEWIVEVTPIDYELLFETAMARLLGLPADASVGPYREVTRAENGDIEIWISTQGYQAGFDECEMWDVSAFLDVVREGNVFFKGKAFRVVKASLSYGLNPADRAIHDEYSLRFSPCAGAITLSPE